MWQGLKLVPVIQTPPQKKPLKTSPLLLNRWQFGPLSHSNSQFIGFGLDHQPFIYENENGTINFNLWCSGQDRHGLLGGSFVQFQKHILVLLPPFHIIRLSSIAHIHIYVNESRHEYMDNARKSYNMKRRKYINIILHGYHDSQKWPFTGTEIKRKVNYAFRWTSKHTYLVLSISSESFFLSTFFCSSKSIHDHIGSPILDILLQRRVIKRSINISYVKKGG